MTRQKKTLSEMLVELGLLSPEQAREARKEEELTKQPFRKIIVQKGFISEEDLIYFMASNMNLPQIELENYIIDPKIIELIPEGLARKHQIVPLFKIANTLTCAMFDPLNIFAIDELRNKTGFIAQFINSKNIQGVKHGAGQGVGDFKKGNNLML